MKQRILGVDCGSYSIKIAEFERSMRSFELVGFYEMPVVPGQSPETRPESVALQRLFEEYNLKGDFIFTALPGQKTAIRVIDLPFSNFKKIDATIEFEMENYLPLPLEEVAVDYEILSSGKSESKVLVSYVRKGELIKYLNFFSAIELDPQFIGSEPVEIPNLLKLGVSFPEGAYALIDLGHEKTNLCLFTGKALQAARTILIGGKDLTRAIASSLKLPEGEASRIKIEMGQVGPAVEGADPMTRQVSEALTGPLGELSVQIKQTLLTFQQEKGEVVQAILLTGGTSRLNGIDQYFSLVLRKNVTFLDCLDIATNRLSESQWCRPIAATALALGYRGVVGAKNRDIQFRRGEFAYRGEVRDLSGLVRDGAIQLGIVLAFVLVTFLASYASLKGKVREQGRKLAAVAGEVLPDMPKKNLTRPREVLSALNGRLNDLNERSRKIEEETTRSLVGILKEVSASVPPRDKIKLDVDDLTITQGRIRITGKANSFDAVDQIKTALSASPRFQNVAADNVRKGVGDQVRFDISLELKQTGANDGT